MTTMEIPAPVAGRRPTPAGSRFVDVRANLMPPEVLSARQVDVVRRRVLIALAALVAVLLAGFGVSWLQTHSARDDLADLHRSIAAQQVEQAKFAKLAQAQTEAQTARAQLATLMTGDLSWSRLLATLRAVAPSGVKLTGVGGSINSASGVSGGSGTADTTTTGTTTAAGGANPLTPAGASVVGTLTLNGTAGDARSVAAYADALGKTRGITSVFVPTVTRGSSGGGASSSSGVTFSVTASVTSALLGGRFTPATTTTTTAPTTTGGN